MNDRGRVGTSGLLWIPTIEVSFAVISSALLFFVGDDSMNRRNNDVFTYHTVDLSLALLAALSAGPALFRKTTAGPGRMQIFYAVAFARAAVSQITNTPNLSLTSLLFAWPAVRMGVVITWCVGWMLWFERSKTVAATFLREPEPPKISMELADWMFIPAVELALVIAESVYLLVQGEGWFHRSRTPTAFAFQTTDLLVGLVAALSVLLAFIRTWRIDPRRMQTFYAVQLSRVVVSALLHSHFTVGGLLLPDPWRVGVVGMWCLGWFLVFRTAKRSSNDSYERSGDLGPPSP